MGLGARFGVCERTEGGSGEAATASRRPRSSAQELSGNGRQRGFLGAVARAIAGRYVSAALSRDAGQRRSSYWRFAQRGVGAFSGGHHPAAQRVSETALGGFPSLCHFPGYGASGRRGFRGGLGAGYSRPEAGFGVL